MSQLINNEQKLIDIIFADRNKEYGAYAIRSSYGETVFKSLSFMLIGIGSVMSLAFYLSNRNNPEPETNSILTTQDSIYEIRVDLEKDDPKGAEKKVDPPSSKEKTNPDEGGKLVVTDSTFEKAVTSTTTAAVTNTVTDGADIGGIAKTGSISSGFDKGTRPDTTKKISEGFEVDTPPEFEGGLSALSKFVAKNLKYPAWASDEGKDGTVFVKFVVDENGKVGSLNLLNSIGYGMDDEALRVVSLIPKFKSPAKVKGQAVKVYYQMPIRFRFR